MQSNSFRRTRHATLSICKIGLMIRSTRLTTHSTRLPTRSTRFSLVVLVFPLVVLVCSLVVLVCPFVCPLVVLVCPLVVSVYPLVVLVVLSVGLFITDPLSNLRFYCFLRHISGKILIQTAFFTFIFVLFYLQWLQKVFGCLIINAQIYNLISVPEITRFLLEDAIISSKTNPCSGSTKQKRSNGFVRNNKTMPGIFLFVWTLYLKQWSPSKEFSQFRKLQVLDLYWIMNGHMIRSNTSSKHKKTETI